MSELASDSARDHQLEQVLAWRERQALALGLSLADAARFAASDGDVDLLRRLVGKGCPPDQAARIVI